MLRYEVLRGERGSLWLILFDLILSISGLMSVDIFLKCALRGVLYWTSRPSLLSINEK